jgi:hypothetical protein
MSRSATIEETWKIRFRVHGHIKTALVTAKDHKRAEGLAHSYPNVISVSKASNDYYRIERRELITFTDKLMADIAQPKMSPLALDEFIWMRRNKRVENREKDKTDS